jgi:hypothetical protein
MTMRNMVASDYLLVCLWLFHAGFFVTIVISAVMLKSNDNLRKQTALKVCGPSYINIFSA